MGQYKLNNILPSSDLDSTCVGMYDLYFIIEFWNPLLYSLRGCLGLSHVCPAACF